MLKMKKRSLQVVLAFVMLLALSCSAWAVTGQQKADATYGVASLTVSDDIETTASGDAGYGIWAVRSGYILVPEPGYSITTSGDQANGAASGIGSSLDITGNIVTRGDAARGVYVYTYGYATMKGTIVTYGPDGVGFEASYPGGTEGGPLSIGVYEGEITTYGDSSFGTLVGRYSTLDLNNTDIMTYGPNAHGLVANNGGIVTMTGGTIVVDDATSYSLSAQGGADKGAGTINLNGVTAESENLLVHGIYAAVDDTPGAGGVVNATNCTLAGDVLHNGIKADTLTINLNDTTWSGTAEASGDIGQIDISLESSTWNVTGDSDTNGKVTGDADSKVDFNGTEDNITVEIDSLAGDPAIDMKVGDTLVIKNTDGSITDMTSSNPDVVEVVIDPDTGAITIVSKSDGDAEIEYTYIDENNVEQTKTIGITSGEGGSTPTDDTDTGTRSYGSSGCNAGFGALFAVLGLALVQRRK